MDNMNEPSQDQLDEVEVIYLDDEDAENLETMDDFEEDENIPEEILDISKLAFSKHTGSVFSCALNKAGTMAITGGEDDLAYLWDTSNGEVILECTGHKDSVTEVGFNHTDEMVATSDMTGITQVWHIADKKLLWCYESDETEWMQWHHSTNVLFLGTSSGEVYIFHIPSGTSKVFPSPGFSATCGSVLPDGKRLLVGYLNGTLKLWDIKGSSTVWQFTDPDAVPIHSLAMNSDASLIAVCPSCAIIKGSDGKQLSKYLTEGEDEVESVKFNSELGILATGALSGQICVWELGKHVVRHQAKIECPVTKMKFGKNGRLLIGATDGAIYVCDARTGLLVETLTGHRSDILDLTISSDGAFVVSVSDDGTARLFNIKSD